MKYRHKELFERQAPWWKFDAQTRELLEALAEYNEEGTPTNSADIAMCMLLAFEYQDNGALSDNHKEILRKNPLLKLAFEHITDCMYEADMLYNHRIESGRKGGKAKRNTSAIDDSLVNNDLPYEL